MNSRQDLLLLGLASSLLVVGLVAAFAPQTLRIPAAPQGEEKSAVLQKIMSAAPAGNAYPAVPRASLDDNVKDWQSPEEDDDNWDYDLFTSIDVVWDPAIKEYVPRARKAAEMPPFGITLVSVAHPVYPYILSDSKFAGTSRAEADRIFSLRHVKTKRYLDDCGLNVPIPDHPGMVLKSYRVVKGKDEDGLNFTRNVLTIQDKEFGLIEIDDEKPLEFKDRTDILLASVADAGWTRKLANIGEKFTYEGAEFTVKAIDMKAKSVTLEKSFALNPKKPKKLIQDLQVLAVPAPLAPVNNVKPTPSAKPNSSAKPTIAPLPAK